MHMPSMSKSDFTHPILLAIAAIVGFGLILWLVGCVQQPQQQAPSPVPPAINVQVDIPRGCPPGRCPGGVCPTAVPPPAIVVPLRPSLHIDVRIPIGASRRLQHRM